MITPHRLEGDTAKAAQAERNAHFQIVIFALKDYTRASICEGGEFWTEGGLSLENGTVLPSLSKKFKW
jgi:hypothetical protein